MKIIGINGLWQLLKWVAICMVVYAIVHAGLSPSVICFLLLARLAIKLVFQLIGGIFQIGIVFIILWLLTLL